MKYLKKLTMLMLALLMSVSIASFVACDEEEGASSVSSSEQTSGPEEAPITEFFPKVNTECTISLQVGEEYALGYTPASGEFKISWTGDATLTINNQNVTNGAVIELEGKSNTLKLIPTDTTKANEIKLTIAEIAAAEVKALVLGENAIEVTDYEGTKVTFTATEAGSYKLSAAQGETKANASIVTANSSEMIELPYTVTLAVDQVITFNISSTSSTTPDTVNVVWEKI